MLDGSLWKRASQQAFGSESHPSITDYWQVHLRYSKQWVAVKQLAHLGDGIFFRLADHQSMRLARGMTSTLLLTIALLVGLGLNQINEADKAKKK